MILKSVAVPDGRRIVETQAAGGHEQGQEPEIFEVVCKFTCSRSAKQAGAQGRGGNDRLRAGHGQGVQQDLPTDPQFSEVCVAPDRVLGP